jgi:DNA-binding XRE family transcriptional regulator
LSSDWISARFRDERARLELTHVKVAKVAGVSRNAVMAWEKETSIPADALAKLSQAGFDPQYVVTGVHSRNLDTLHDTGVDAERAMTKDEWTVLRDYRALSGIQRDQARAMMQVLKVGMPIAGSNVVIGKGGRTAGRDIVQGVPASRMKPRK